MFGLNHYKQSKTVAPNRPFIPYTASEIEALIAGYVEMADDRAYNGRFFVKSGKKWIHNLNSLRKKLSEMYGRYIDDEELNAGYPEGFGYDVENYYSRNNQISLAQKREFQELIQSIKLN